MHIIEILVQFGLSEKEAYTYLSLLQLGKGSILDIARHSGIKRTTIYNAIHALETQGLVYQVIEGKRIRYKPHPPSELKRILKQREEELSFLLPQLEGMTQNVPRGTLSIVQYREGFAEVQKAYQLFFAECEPESVVYAFRSEQGIKSQLPELSRDQYTIHELVSSPQMLKKTSKEMRVLPKELQPFKTDCLISEQKTMLISFEPTVSTIIISDKSIAHSFRSLFEAAWCYAGIINVPRGTI